MQEPWGVSDGAHDVWKLQHRGLCGVCDLYPEDGSAVCGESCGDPAAAYGILCICRKGT